MCIGAARLVLFSNNIRSSVAYTREPYSLQVEQQSRSGRVEKSSKRMVHCSFVRPVYRITGFDMIRIFE